MTPALQSISPSFLLSSHCLPPTLNNVVEMGQSRNPGESSLVIYGLSSVNCVCPKSMGLWGKGQDNPPACSLSKCPPSSDSLLQGRLNGGYFWPESLLAAVESVELKLPGFESSL